MSELADVTVAATDLCAACAFYDAALGAVGFVRVAELVDEEEDGAAVEAVGWGPPDGPARLWVVPSNTATTGLHVRFRAHSRREVETFASDGVRAGGSLHAAPRRWTLYRRGEYGAMVRDPNGNLVEVVAAE